MNQKMGVFNKIAKSLQICLQLKAETFLFQTVGEMTSSFSYCGVPRFVQY